MEAQKPLEQETPETTPQEAPTATIPPPESTPAANMEADPIPEEMDAPPESPAKKTAGKLAALIGGGIVAVLQICGVSYKDGYKHLFVVTVVITLMALALSILMGNILYPIAA